MTGAITQRWWQRAVLMATCVLVPTQGAVGGATDSSQQRDVSLDVSDDVSVTILGPGSTPSNPTYGVWATVNTSWSCSTGSSRTQERTQQHREGVDSTSFTDGEQDARVVFWPCASVPVAADCSGAQWKTASGST